MRRRYRTWLIWSSPRPTCSPSRWTTSCAPTPPGSGTLFAQRLDELRGLAGAANLAVDVLPACSLTREGSVDAEQRDAYLAALESRMAQFAGHV